VDTVRLVTLYRLFRRQNPALPPCRRRRTANHWALGADLLLRAAETDTPEAVRWAARELLTLESGITMPPLRRGEGEPDFAGMGSRRRYARDGGGIAGAVLLTLANVVVDRELGHLGEKEVHAAEVWSLLFPHTARLGGPPHEVDFDEVLSEWQLLDEPAQVQEAEAQQQEEAQKPVS